MEKGSVKNQIKLFNEKAKEKNNFYKSEFARSISCNSDTDFTFEDLPTQRYSTCGNENVLRKENFPVQKPYRYSFETQRRAKNNEIEKFVLERKAEILKFQIKQLQSSNVMYQSVIKEVSYFLDSAYEKLKQKNENEQSSVTNRVRTNSKDYSYQQGQKNLNKEKQKFNSECDKIAEEAFRLNRMVKNLLSIAEPEECGINLETPVLTDAEKISNIVSSKFDQSSTDRNNFILQFDSSTPIFHPRYSLDEKRFSSLYRNSAKKLEFR